MSRPLQAAAVTPVDLRRAASRFATWSLYACALFIQPFDVKHAKIHASSRISGMSD